MIASFTLHFKKVTILFVGAVAQLVERMDGIHEATGSIPVSSTILRQGYVWQAIFFNGLIYLLNVY